MKSLSKYLLESVAPIFEMAKDKDSLIKQLSSNADLGGYVDYLNKMLDDPDAKAVLLNAFLNSDDDAYEFTGKMVNLDVTKLHPTQSEIDVDKSLGYPFKNESAATSSMKMFFDSAVAQMPFH